MNVRIVAVPVHFLFDLRVASRNEDLRRWARFPDQAMPVQIPACLWSCDDLAQILIEVFGPCDLFAGRTMSIRMVNLLVLALIFLFLVFLFLVTELSCFILAWELFAICEGVDVVPFSMAIVVEVVAVVYWMPCLCLPCHRAFLLH